MDTRGGAAALTLRDVSARLLAQPIAIAAMRWWRHQSGCLGRLFIRSGFAKALAPQLAPGLELSIENLQLGCAPRAGFELAAYC